VITKLTLSFTRGVLRIYEFGSDGTLIQIVEIPPNWESKRPLKNLSRRASRIMRRRITYRELCEAHAQANG
jgi:hypothetical protein